MSKNKNNKHHSQHEQRHDAPAKEGTPSKIWDSQGSFVGGLGKGYKHDTHDAVKPIMIGGYPVHLGRRPDLTATLVARMDIICPLNGQMPPVPFGSVVSTVSCELADYGGVPKGFPKFIENIANKIVGGKLVLAYCTGGHGRTGTFGAALIAVMEPNIQDPIAEIRKRHCKEAVETLKQADAIFALKGGLAPQNYEDEFRKPSFSNFSGGSSFGFGQGSSPKTEKVWEKNAQGVYEEVTVKSQAAVVGSGSKTATRKEVEGMTPLMTGDAEGQWYYMPGRGMVHVSDADEDLEPGELEYLKSQFGVGF